MAVNLKKLEGKNIVCKFCKTENIHNMCLFCDTGYCEKHEDKWKEKGCDCKPSDWDHHGYYVGDKLNA